VSSEIFAPRLTRLRLDQGLLRQAQGNLPEAEDWARKALEPAERVARQCPRVPSYASDLARIHLHHGEILQALGRLPDADQAYAQAGELLEKLAADFPERATDRSNLGRGLDAQAQL